MAVGGRSGGPGGKTNVCAGDAAPVLAPTGPKNGSRDVLRVEAVPVVLVSPKLLEREDLKIESRSSKIRDFRYLKNPKRAKGALLGHSVSQSDAISIVNPSFGVRHPSIIHCSSIESFLAVQVDVNLFLAQH